MNQLINAGGRVAGLVALNLAFLAQPGCEGAELAVGQTGTGLDWEHCYGEGINCSSSVTAEKGRMPEIRSCSETELGPLEKDPSFALEFKTSCPVAPIKVANDGTIWALESEGAPVVVGSGSYCETSYQYLHLTHYSADGTVLGRTPALFPQFGEVRSFSLNVDAVGNAILTYGEASASSDPGIYPVVLTSDGKVEFATTIRTFDAQLQQVGETLVLRGLEKSQVVPAEPGVLGIAGTRVTSQSCSEGAGYSLGSSSGPIESTDPGSYQAPWVSRRPTLCSYGSHGVLLRVNGKAPDYIQTHATQLVEGTIPSVVSIAVSGAGASFVLMHYQCVNGTSGTPFNRLSRFDSQGNLVWELDLPDGDYASLVGVADGGVILNGSSSAARVFHVSPSGTIDWAYQSQSAQTPAADLVGQLGDASFSELCFTAESTRESTEAISQSQSAQGFVTDPDTGMTIARLPQWNDDGTRQGNSLVTISGDGSRCEMYGLLDSQSTNAKADEVSTVVHAPYVYLQRITDIRRYRLPTP